MQSGAFSKKLLSDAICNRSSMMAALLYCIKSQINADEIASHGQLSVRGSRANVCNYALTWQ